MSVTTPKHAPRTADVLMRREASSASVSRDSKKSLTAMERRPAKVSMILFRPAVLWATILSLLYFLKILKSKVIIVRNDECIILGQKNFRNETSIANFIIFKLQNLLYIVSHPLLFCMIVKLDGTSFLPIYLNINQPKILAF